MSESGIQHIFLYNKMFVKFMCMGIYWGRWVNLGGELNIFCYYGFLLVGSTPLLHMHSDGSVTMDGTALATTGNHIQIFPDGSVKLIKTATTPSEEELETIGGGTVF